MSDDENVKVTYTVNLPQLIKELLLASSHPDHVQCDALKIAALILHELAARASEINDDQLNGILCRLALYDVSDPNYSGYNPDYTSEAINGSFMAKAMDRLTAKDMSNDSEEIELKMFIVDITDKQGFCKVMIISAIDAMEANKIAKGQMNNIDNMKEIRSSLIDKIKPGIIHTRLYERQGYK